MIAILSDIHGNLHALEAVLGDMPKVSDIYVIGDMVGGASPFPCEAMDMLMNHSTPVTFVLGNWEWWMMHNRNKITPELRADKKLAAGVWGIESLKERHWALLESLPRTLTVGDKLFFHGSPEKLTEQIFTQKEAEDLAGRHDAKWLIGGHIHRARLFKVGNRRVLNAGSVGIPCDDIAGAACYALMDGESAHFRHVSYDVEAAVSAIEKSEIYKLANEYARAIISVMRSGNY